MFEKFKCRDAQVVVETGNKAVWEKSWAEAEAKFSGIEEEYGYEKGSMIQVESFELPTAFGTRYQIRITVNRLVPPVLFRAVTKTATYFAECTCVEDDVAAYTLYK